MPAARAIVDDQPNLALFSLLGTTFGGDGQVNFALPNLAGRTVVGDSGTHPLGEVLGTPTISLTLPVPTQFGLATRRNAI